MVCICGMALIVGWHVTSVLGMLMMCGHIRGRRAIAVRSHPGRIRVQVHGMMHMRVCTVCMVHRHVPLIALVCLGWMIMHVMMMLMRMRMSLSVMAVNCRVNRLDVTVQQNLLQVHRVLVMTSHHHQVCPQVGKNMLIRRPRQPSFPIKKIQCRIERDLRTINTAIGKVDSRLFLR